jgi:DNA primase
VSTPVTWDEVADVEPGDCTMAAVPGRFAAIGDLHAGIDDAVFDIAPLLAWAERDEEAGAEPPVEPDED